MAKQNGLDQHDLLHQQWPQDCCLCGKEEVVRLLQWELQKLREYIRSLEDEVLINRLRSPEVHTW